MKTRVSRSAEVRAKLDYPIIDGDGHLIESMPVVLDYVRQVGGSRMVERYTAARAPAGPSSLLGAEHRRDAWQGRRAWWALPTEATLDRASAHLPKLLHERMDELGLDYTILYPTLGLGVVTLPGIADDEVRRVAARAFNTYYADHLRDYRDRMTPAAIIPMGTPQEALEELEYAVKVLGLKVMMVQGHVLRSIAKLHRLSPDAFEMANRMDVIGLDSDYDYDPVWAKCLELKVAVTCHSGMWGWGQRRSPSSYAYSHIGNFGAAGEAFCKAILMGGVTRRFPDLRFAFLEGGVSWACGLYADLIGHWEKRNGKAIQHLDPARLDTDLMARLVGRYAEGRTAARSTEVMEAFRREREAPRPAEVDEFARCRIETPEEFRDLFARPFYFGCEADDPINAWAFNTRVNPFGVRLNAFFGSDIGHWDVVDMAEVVEEAYGLVQRELITQEDFKDFMFANPARLHAGMNPDFFKGTRVETVVSKLL